MTDQPRAVRAEDAIDSDAVATWLRSALAADAASDADAASGLEGTPQVLQFAGGASNLTYLLTFPSGRELVLRRPPAGTKAAGAHDMAREHDLQAALAPVFPYVPPMVALCRDGTVIGSEFYVMERLVGTILRRDVPPELGLREAEVRVLCERAVDVLVALHGIDPDAAGLGALDRGDGYVQRQVSGWTKRYRAARTPDVPDLEGVMAWLADHQPADRPHRLIHNDFRFDNLVLDPADPTRIVGVLDWELATVGDPLMDLGGALAYWCQADDGPEFVGIRLQPTHAPGMLTRAEVVQRYAAATGTEVTAQQWRFYEVFGLFRLAGIAQQIYYRFFHGQTTNPWFGQFHAFVQVLAGRCERLIAQAP